MLVYPDASLRPPATCSMSSASSGRPPVTRWASTMRLPPSGSASGCRPRMAGGRPLSRKPQADGRSPGRHLRRLPPGPRRPSACLGRRWRVRLDHPHRRRTFGGLPGGGGPRGRPVRARLAVPPGGRQPAQGIAKPAGGGVLAAGLVPRQAKPKGSHRGSWCVCGGGCQSGTGCPGATVFCELSRNSSIYSGTSGQHRGEPRLGGGTARLEAPRIPLRGVPYRCWMAFPEGPNG
jgi:hypothetical protein